MRIKRLNLIQIILLSILIIYISDHLLKYRNNPEQWGPDFKIAYQVVDVYLKTGILYHVNPERHYQNETRYYNVPAMIVLIAPYLLLSYKYALMLKIIISLISVGAIIALCISLTDKKILSNQNAQFFALMLLFSSFLFQLFSLNVYIEILLMLILSLHFHRKDKTITSAFILALAINLKILILPLAAVPLLTREYRYFAYLLSFGILIFLSSLMFFGVQTHIDFITTFSRGYYIEFFKYKHYLIFPDIAADYPCFFLRFRLWEYISENTANFLIGTAALLYCMISLFVFKIMFFKANEFNNNGEKRKEYFQTVFISLLILNLGFNLRTDYSLLLMPACILLSNTRHYYEKLAAYSITGIAIYREIPYYLMGLIIPEHINLMIHKTIYFVPFTFIGINLLVLSVILFWKKAGADGITFTK